MCAGGSWHVPILACFALQGGAIVILTAAERPSYFSGMVLISPLVLANPESATTFKVNRLPVLGESCRAWGWGALGIHGHVLSWLKSEGKGRSPFSDIVLCRVKVWTNTKPCRHGGSVISEVRCVFSLSDERRMVSCLCVCFLGES